LRAIRDTTERKQAERKLRASLEEKETLLREVHHRVKNNLAVISSMFYLESTYTKDHQTVLLLREAQDRVRSMAMVHENLYQSGNLTAVNFGEYAKTVLDSLLRTYLLESTGVTSRTRIDEILLSVELAIPCGLILNELVTNSLKHAFPERRRGELYIGLHQENGRCVLRVADSGVGIPEDLDARKTHSVGLRLVRSLTKQLEGEFSIRRMSPGTVAELCFAITSKPQGTA
jgi:two-component sensor histidine kinase